MIVLWGLLGAGWFATAGLHAGQNWDERYVFENVAPVLRGQGLRPVNGWYPRLSYLPQTALLALSQALSDATGSETLAVFNPRGGFSPTAYLICRWLNTLFGAGCLVVTFLIGRRMFTPSIGVMAALLHSMAPWHIRAAAVFKPDPLLLLLMSLTFYWSLTVIEKGTLRTYLLCGAGVGLAASAKTPGAFASIPLVTLSLLEPLQRTRWLRLGLAGVAAALVFSVVNGYPLYYLRYARSEHEFLTNLPTQKSFSEMLVWALRATGDGSFYGPVLGVVALAGLAGLAVQLYLRRRDRAQRTRLAMFLSLPLFYPPVVAILSDLPKGNYLLPLLPFTSIAAGWILSRVWLWTAGRLPARPRRWLAVPAAIGLIMLAGQQGWTYVYWGGVPVTTTGAAVSLIGSTAPFFNHRVAIFEPGEEAVRLQRARGPRSRTIVATREEPALSDVEVAALDRADYEVFGEQRLLGPQADFYRARIERLDPSQVTFIRPKRFRVRGSPQVLLTHLWHLIGPPLPVERATSGRRSETRFVGRLPAKLGLNRTISLDLAFEGLTPPSRIDQLCELTVAGEPVKILWYQVEEVEERWMTERFKHHKHRAPVQLRCEKGSQIVSGLSSLEAVRWAAKPRGRRWYQEPTPRSASTEQERSPND